MLRRAKTITHKRVAKAALRVSLACAHMENSAHLKCGVLYRLT
jgi:hypothetical protein